VLAQRRVVELGAELGRSELVDDPWHRDSVPCAYRFEEDPSIDLARASLVPSGLHDAASRGQLEPPVAKTILGMNEGERSPQHRNWLAQGFCVAKLFGQKLGVERTMTPDPGALRPKPFREPRQHVLERGVLRFILVRGEHDEPHLVDIGKQHVAGRHARGEIIEREVAVHVHASLGGRRARASEHAEVVDLGMCRDPSKSEDVGR
jgi:hypothetical protein